MGGENEPLYLSKLFWCREIPLQAVPTGDVVARVPSGPFFQLHVPDADEALGFYCAVVVHVATTCMFRFQKDATIVVVVRHVRLGLHHLCMSVVRLLRFYFSEW